MRMLVENNLLESDSAVVLSESIGIFSGMRDPGKCWMVIYTKAI